MKKLLFLLLSVFVFNACNKDEVDQGVDPPQDDKIEPFTLKAKYKGVDYTVSCLLYEELDSIVYLDPEFRDLYLNEISQIPNLATHLTEDGSVEFYITEEEFLTDKNLVMLDPEVETALKNGMELTGRYVMWDDRNYKDRDIWCNIWGYPISTSYAISYLTNYNNFNDKCSSLKVWNYMPPNKQVLVQQPFTYKNTNDLRVKYVAFENSSFHGRTLEIVLGCQQSREYPNLKHVPCGSGNWCDRISSLQFQMLAIR